MAKPIMQNEKKCYITGSQINLDKQKKLDAIYITKRGRRWRVNITRKGFTYDRTFGTIEEAIAVREVILNGVQYLAD